MRPLPFRLLALLLPVAGLGGAWGWTHVHAQQGVEWDVPVSASGPRASLRGRYVVFRYDWKLPDAVDVETAQALCLEGAPPRLASVRVAEAGDKSCRHLAQAVESGILYIPQERVPSMRRELADPELTAIARIRVNDSGAITPREIRFRARSKPALPSP